MKMQAIAFVPVRVGEERLAACVKRVCASAGMYAVGLVGFGRDSTNPTPGVWPTLLDGFLHAKDLPHAAEYHIPFLLRTRRIPDAMDFPTLQTSSIAVISSNPAAIRSSLIIAGFDTRACVFSTPEDSLVQTAMAVVTDSTVPTVVDAIRVFCESNGRAFIRIVQGGLADYGGANGIWVMSGGVLHAQSHAITLGLIDARRRVGQQMDTVGRILTSENTDDADSLFHALFGEDAGGLDWPFDDSDLEPGEYPGM